MTLQELKNQLVDRSFCSDKLIIFKCQENNFIADQYTNMISKIKNIDIEYIEDISALLIDSEDIFGTETLSPTLRVLKCDNFSCTDVKLMQLSNVIIITESIDNEVLSQYKNYIITVPKLLDWQIKDYIYSSLRGVDKKKLDWIQIACKNDIYKIDNEVNMMKIFEPNEQEFLFNSMWDEGMFSDITNFNIFNLTNALASRDIETVKTLYLQKDSMDISDMALLTLVYQNFRNLILVRLNPNPTTENTGLSDKQIYAIKKIPLNYTKEELYKIFEKITSIDSRIKSGTFPIDLLFDYIIVAILGVK